MTSQERVTAVLNHTIPDRVPTYEVLIAADMVSEVISTQGKSSWELTAEELTELTVKLKQDAVVFPFVYKPRSIFMNKIVELDSLKLPEEWFYIRLEAFKKVMECARSANLAVIPHLHGCFDLPYEVMGFEHYMIMVLEDFPYVDAVTEYFWQVAQFMIGELIKVKPDAIYIGDDLCYNNGLMINENTFLKLWYEREKQLVSMCKKSGIPVEFHTDGNLSFVMEHLISMGIDLVNPIDANCNDIFDVKNKYGSRIALRGNINVSGPLYYGPYEAVYQETKDKLLPLKVGGNYILSSSHSITPKMSYKNYLGITDALEEFGWY